MGKRQRVYLTLAILRGLLSAAWFIQGVVFYNRVVWADSLALVPAFVGTGILFLLAAIYNHMHRLDKRAAAEAQDDLIDWSLDELTGIVRRFSWAVALVDLSGLVAVAVYTYHLAGLVTNASEQALAISALTFLAATAAVQVATIISMINVVYSCCSTC